jgi:hypothetical protein
LRITIQSNAENGLKRISQVMIDKIMTVKRKKIGKIFGRIDIYALEEIERCLAVFLWCDGTNRQRAGVEETLLRRSSDPRFPRVMR